MDAPRASATGIRRPASGITIDTGRLVRLRREKSWERHDLAREAGVSVSMIAMIERKQRRPSTGTLRAICTALGCNATDLLPELPEKRTA